MLPQPRLRSGMGTGRLDDLIGQRFALVYCGAHSISSPPRLLHPLWRRLDAAMIWILPQRALGADASVTQTGWQTAVDLDGSLTAVLNRYIGRTIVLRPDRYAAGSFGATEEQSFADAFTMILGIDSAADPPGAPAPAHGGRNQGASS
jgi:3-(3-hydroxy-phenyl)propionate hydroxylase